MKRVLGLILIFIALSVRAQQPRLLIYVSIDGLNPYEIESYSGSLEKDGIVKFTTKANCYNPKVLCNYITSSPAAFYATVMTGMTPNMHGIVGSRFHSTADNSEINCVEDPRYEGINTKETVSPRLLQARTIADNLKIAYPNSKVYSIATTAESAIMMGGHLANGAVWFNQDSAMWCTSNFYDNGLPTWATDRREINKHLGEPWKPMRAISTYRFQARSKNTWNKEEPVFGQIAGGKELVNSPLINEVITRMAIKAIRSELLGTDESPDMLMIEYTLKTPYLGTEKCAETEDAMMRLDQEFRELTDAIDLSVGLNNTVIIVTGTPARSTEKAENISKKLPRMTFNSERAMALLNAYLMAIYGQGRWVERYKDGQVYLNHQLIDNQNISYKEIEEKTAQFLTEFSTVLTATATNGLNVLATGNGGYLDRLANTIYKHRSGDVVVTLLPGVTEEGKNETINFQPIYVPVAIYAEDEVIEKPKDTRDIYEEMSRELLLP